MPPRLGATNGDLSNDDYVAQVLAREAQDNSLNYAVQGTGAYMPRRPTGAAPKPNTRFLRHIIKETDSHNATLKRKEEREARERMRQRRNRPQSPSHDSSEQRPGSHRTSGLDLQRERERRQDREDRHRSHRRRHRSRSNSGDRERSRRHRRRHDDDSDAERREPSHKRRRYRSYSRSRSRSPRGYDSKSRRRRHREHTPSSSRSRSRSPARNRDRRSTKEYDRKSHHRSRERSSPHRQRPAPSRKEAPPPPPSERAYESDPLEDLVGPLPLKDDNTVDAPVRSRGRGAYNLSNIDAHFAPDYDPTLDVQLDETETTQKKPSRRHVPGLMTGDDDDWELALEAVRDRARWRQRGEERLREAGFNDEFVERWKSNTTSSTAGDRDNEGSLEDVRWSKKGEGREWDRGKFVDDDGHVDVKASWG